MKTLQGDLSIEEIAQKLANNHNAFDCFIWDNEPSDSENWCIVYTNGRDSGLIEESNAAAIEAELPCEED